MTSNPTPAAPVQNPLWLLQQLDPTSSAYNVAFHLDFEGPLEVAAMQAAWQMVVERHEIIRCRFRPGPEGATLSPLPVEALPLELEPVNEPERAALVRAHALAPFDLEAGPPARARLYRSATERHTLGFSFHHSVFDGWSLNVLMKELAAAYDHALGHGPPLSALSSSYLDHAERAATELAAGVHDAELEYWRAQLSGAPSDLGLPRRRSAPGPRAGDTLRASLGSQTDALQALSARAEATPFMVMLAAYAGLLGRYSDASEVVVGTPLATRVRPRVRPLLGLFLNTVALRIDLSGRPTFLDLVARVKAAALGAFRNYRVPFERVVEALHPERRPGQTPIFSTMFITQHPPPSCRFRGLHYRYFDDDPDAVKFDLTLSTQVLEQEVTASLEYASDRLDETEADAMLDAYRVMLGHALEAPERPVSSLTWQDRAHSRAQATRFVGPVSEAPLVDTLDAVEAMAARHPARVAVRDAEGARSYAEVWDGAIRIARGLRAQGIGDGDIVGVRVGRDRYLPESLLGVMLSGAAYIPVDPDAPARRSRATLEDAEAKALLVDSDDAAVAPKSVQVFLRDKLEPTADLGPRPPLEALAYIIYTSGSSGRPKGVAVPRSALAAFHRGAVETLALTEADRFFAQATVSFDPSLLELLTPLTIGASTYVVPRDVATDGQRLAEAIATSEASVYQTTPTGLRMLMQADWHPAPSLRVFVGGEGLPRDLAAQLLPKVSGLVNIYGPTEATVWSAGLPVTEALLEGAPEVLPIGGVFGDARYYLLCDNGCPVPPGASGEICICGPQVADGYVKRPALDADRFVRDPFVPGAAMYRTGDVGRARPDGTIEFLGRRDKQVKVRGFRVEPAEIEAALRRQPGLHDAVATIVDHDGHPELAAYVVGDVLLDQDNLRGALREELPAYMVPTLLHVLPELPRTANGKLDHARLPKPSAQVRRRVRAEPDNEIEARLLEIWRALLGRRDVGIHDNFFDIGGHSMLAARLADRVDKSFGRRLDVSTFFHAQTVAQQARVILDGGYTPPTTALAPLKTSGSRRPFYFIGASNQARPLADFLHPEQPMYVMRVLALPDGHSMEVPDVAATYARQIQEFQPEGPYAIGAFCQDGKLAYAVAERLVAEGKEVARLVYIDVVWLAQQQVSLRRHFAKKVVEMGPGYAVHWVRQRVMDRTETAGQIIYDQVMSRRPGKTEEKPITTRHRERIYALRASMEAAPEVAFSGDVDVILSQEYYTPGAERALAPMGTGRVRVFEIPGTHHHIFFPPAVHWLAARISRCLEEAFSEGDEEAPAAPRSGADQARA